jgi:hypothetical protein
MQGLVPTPTRGISHAVIHQLLQSIEIGTIQWFETLLTLSTGGAEFILTKRSCQY